MIRPPRFPRSATAADDEPLTGWAVVSRILFAMIWLPIQISIMLLFATGGIMLLLMLALALAPFAGLALLIRRLVRGPTSTDPMPRQRLLTRRLTGL